MRRLFGASGATVAPAALLALVMLVAPPASAQERGAVALGELVSGLGVSARVLVIGAHPDDEDTRLIAWLARGRHVETAYLSLTRGDGGQNLIGNELGEALGVIRTEELLAARRIDGAHQYFTRAYDFGFSKSAEETYRHWPHDSLLRDVVTVVRAFRPHVIVAVFSGTPADGHGHHIVSGLMAREAYDVAGDTVKLPSSATAGLPGWTPLKFYRGTSYRNNVGATYLYNGGEYSPLLGRSYTEIAGESRSQHKSQAFGVLQRKGVSIGSVRREASRVNADAPAEKERGLFDGIDTTYARIRGVIADRRGSAMVDSIVSEIARARAAFDPFAPRAEVAPLQRFVDLSDRVCSMVSPSGCDVSQARRGGEPLRDAVRSLSGLRARAGRALDAARGIAIEANVSRELWAVGEPVPVTTRVYNRGQDTLVLAMSAPSQDGKGASPGERSAIAPDSAQQREMTIAATVPTQPWWLERPRQGDMFDTRITGVAEDERAPAAGVAVAIAAGNRERVVPAEVAYRFADPIRGDLSRPAAFVPEMSVTLDRDVEYAQANAPLDRIVRVTVRSAASVARDVRVELRLPVGLNADSAARTVNIPAGAVRVVTFRVRGRLGVGRQQIRASATTNGKSYTAGYTLVDYEHIRPQRMYRTAVLAIEAIDVTLPPGLNVAYIRGVGDNIPPILEQLGVKLTALEATQIPSVDLSHFSAILVGPRAYESNADLVANNNRLLDYVKAGGTMMVQYGQYEMQQPGILPYPITLVRPADRVTEEDAAVRVLDSSSRLLSAPNRIGAGDFAGWIQDRAMYMPRTFDPAYTPLLAMNDPGEPENRGALLVAKYGSGTYVYTTLAFFRQLPAGVPGAARLFVNLMAAGDTRTVGGPPRRDDKPVP
jgi:LmbE family N-acetylglucosaminyl deacetylase